MISMPVGVCIPTPGRDGGIIEDRDLARIARMGFRGVRQNGHVLNPRVPGMIDVILAHDLTPLITLDFRTHNGEPEILPAAYGLRVAAIAGQSIGREALYEIDNEPKIMGGIEPHVYAAYARAGFDAIRAVNPQAKVLIAGEIYEPPVNQRRRLGNWFEQMVARLGPIYREFDGVAIHPYTNDGGQPDDRVFSNYETIAQGLPLYVTEDGAKPTEPRGQTWHVEESIRSAERTAEWFCVYQWRADPDPRADFGLLDPEEQPRPIAKRLAELMGGTV